MLKKNIFLKITTDKFQYIWMSLFLPFIFSCSTLHTHQSQINHYQHSHHYEKALEYIDDHKEVYGKNNRLLYFLDQAMLFHLKGDYQKSIKYFDQAKRVYDELYTLSLTRLAGSWVLNDYSLPYRGEDFERIMINVFQALNYICLNNLEDALVEAREVDSKLLALNAQYKPGQKNVYKEDAFVRLLMGILYEVSGEHADLNNAFISYRNALSLYENDYGFNYNTDVPSLLKENLLTLAAYMDQVTFKNYQKRFSNILFYSLKNKNQKGEVYIIEYSGLSPRKTQEAIPIPLPDGAITQVAFPKYQKRPRYDRSYLFIAQNNIQHSRIFKTRPQLGEDISAIAIKNLENRRGRVLAKAIARPTMKYIIQKKQTENIRKKHGKEAAEWFRFGMNIFNLYSEQADVRSWRSLPSEIRIGRLLLPPGNYSLSLGPYSLGSVSIQAGDKRFYVFHTF